MRFRIYLLVILVLMPAAAFATPYDTFSVGPRAIAMGNAYGAVGGDSAACFHNIATLTNAGAFQIELDYHRADIDIRFNDRRTDIDPDKGVRIGVVLGKTFLNRRFRFGASIYTPDSHFMRFVLPPRTAPIVMRYNNINHMQASIVGFAGQVFPWWSIGFGATFTSDHLGGVDFAIGEDTAAQGDLKSRLGSATTPVAGTYFEPLEWLSLGATFREEHQQMMHLPNKIGMNDLKVFQDNGLIIFQDGRLVLDVYSNTHFSPRQYQGAIAIKPSDRMLFSADLTFYEYSNMGNSMAYSIAIMEGDFGEVFPCVPPLDVPDPGMEDTWGLALGTEWGAFKTDHVRVDLRAGYNYRPTPLPNQTGVSNVIDSNMHIMAAGLGLTLGSLTEVLRKPFSLDVFYQHHYLEPRMVHKSDPTNEIGDYKFTGSVGNLGAGMTLRF